MPDKTALKTKILLPLSLALVALYSLFIFSLYQHENSSLSDEFRNYMQSVQSYFHIATLHRAEKLGVGLEVILGDKKLQAALRAKDRAALLKQATPLFKKLQEQYGITHFYFEDAARVNILRVHQPERYGDTINRFTTLEAEKTGKMAFGMELGINGALTERAVAPMFDKTGLVGYVELGQGVEDILHETVHVFDAVHLIVLDKRWLTREDWERGMRMLNHPANWEQLSNEVVTHQDIKLSDKIIRTLNGIPPSELIADLNIDGKDYYAGAMPLDDVAGKRVGKLIALHDSSVGKNEMQRTMFNVSCIASLMGAALLVLFYVLTSRVDRQRKAFQQKIIAQKDEVQRLNETLEQRIQEEVGKSRKKDLLLIQQSRMAAMGEMIRNIAHQWRQPLNLIGLITQNISMDFESKTLSADRLKKDTTTILLTVQKMSDTIDVFRNFLRPDQQKSAFNLAQAVQDALNLVDASLKNQQIQVSVEINGDLHTTGFPHEFAQILVNIFNNAMDSIAERQVINGTIAVTLGGDREKNWILIRDNGGGIPKDFLPKIFEPYYTTKPNGTGIGLYMSRMLIEHMGGSIEARNVDDGAEFRLNMPLSTMAARPDSGE